MGSKRVLDLFWRHRRSYVSPIDFARIRSWIRWMGLLFAIFVLYTWMDSFFFPLVPHFRSNFGDFAQVLWGSRRSDCLSHGASTMTSLTPSEANPLKARIRTRPSARPHPWWTTPLRMTRPSIPKECEFHATNGPPFQSKWLKRCLRSVLGNKWCSPRWFVDKHVHIIACPRIKEEHIKRIQKMCQSCFEWTQTVPSPIIFADLWYYFVIIAYFYTDMWDLVRSCESVKLWGGRRLWDSSPTGPACLPGWIQRRHLQRSLAIESAILDGTLQGEFHHHHRPAVGLDGGLGQEESQSLCWALRSFSHERTCSYARPLWQVRCCCASSIPKGLWWIGPERMGEHINHWHPPDVGHQCWRVSKASCAGTEDASDECHRNRICRHFWWKGRCFSICCQSKGWSWLCHRGNWRMVEGDHHRVREEKMGSAGPAQLHCMEPWREGLWRYRDYGGLQALAEWDERSLLPAASQPFGNATAAAPGLLRVQCKHQPGYPAISYQWCGPATHESSTRNQLATPSRWLLAMSAQGC